MKFRRLMSSLLFGAGCALIFIAILSIVLPRISNAQMQLVLASFEMSSPHAAVRAVNGFMSFALAHGLQLLYLGLLMAGVGALLMLHFTPSHRSREQAAPPPQMDPPAVPEENPFANVLYPELEPPTPSGFFQKETGPILERNRLEEDDPPCFDEARPYFSPRLEAESHAMAADPVAPSQSGSRMLIRTSYAPAEATESSTAPAPIAPRKAAVSAAAPATPTASASPRIRSTMGQRRIEKRNLL